MIKSIAIKRSVNDQLTNMEDVVAIEEPLEIQLEFGASNERKLQSLSVTMRTPGNDDELAIGFLFTEGLITAPVVNKNDGTTVFSKILKLYPNGEQRTFKEARGLVINDYQNFLEAKWIEQLKKQYPVKIDEKVFQTLSK